MKAQSHAAEWVFTRCEFLKASGLVVAGLSAGAPFARADGMEGKAKLRFGIVTDAHYAVAPSRGTRHYGESMDKMAECVALMNDQKVDFLIELGDFKDEGKPASEESTLEYLKRIEAVFGKFKGPRYHVLGNHDVDSLSKEKFLDHVENTGIANESSYYSFDSKGMHFIVLDADYTSNGTDYDHGNFNWMDTNIPDRELDWLKKDLAATSKPVITFVHQQLNVTDQYHSIKNAEEVRRVLEESGKVLAVFQGHNHAGAYSHIEDIHYYTLKALVEGSGAENNSYAIVEVQDGRDIVVTGYRRAAGKIMVG
ncbi:MAG: metallophosphoesterase [Verrucomicrobia bacterium]|nr:metallophosphoesterase [Verrucomicrobiota bacterium]